MSPNTPDLSVHHQLPEFTQTHVYQIGDVIQPSHPLSSPSPAAPNSSQHQGLFQWVNSPISFTGPHFSHMKVEKNNATMFTNQLWELPMKDVGQIQITGLLKKTTTTHHLAQVTLSFWDSMSPSANWKKQDKIKWGEKVRWGKACGKASQAILIYIPW